MNKIPKAKAIDLRPKGLLPRIKWREVLVLVAGFCMVLFTPGVRAQSGAGSIQGTVTDSTGAVLPGATIHVVNQATGVVADTKTNSVGFYQVPDLFAGTYSVSISAPNMKTYVRTLQLLVAQTAAINATMTPGEVTQQISVTADLVQLTNSENGTISSTIENERISQLPSNGRNLLTLASETTPGLEGGDRDNGLMPEALEFVADGVPVDNDNFGGQMNTYGALLPDVDSIQEVSFNMTDAPSKYATPGTAVITTKSGTNSLHGSLFETSVNSYWGVAKVRQNPANYAAPPYIRNEFGASAGGPIILPWLYHGKDKSFWFFSYERYSLASTASNQTIVPTDAMRKGDFSGLSNAAGQLQVLYDPATTKANAACPNPATGKPENNPYCRTPFPNNQIPTSLQSPLSKILNAITPEPTNSQNPLVGNNLNSPNVNYVAIPTITFRLDHNFNEANKGYLRYTSNNEINRALRSSSPATITSPDAPGFPAAASGDQVIPVSNYAGALGYTHIFSPAFFSETVVSQQWFMQYVGGGGNPNLNYEQMLGLPNNFGETGFPSITGSLMGFGGTMYNYQENQIVSTIDENLTKAVGNHQMEFGGRWRHERFYYLRDRSTDTTAFSANTTALTNPTGGNSYPGYTNTGNNGADLYLGSAQSYSVSLQPPPTWFVDQEFDAYFQDNFRLRRNLILNIGLRYEAHPARQTRDNVTQTFDPNHKAIVLGAPIADLIKEGWTTQAIITNMQNIGVKFETAAEAGYPSALYKSSNFTVSPRTGIAWQPLGNKWGTTLRGGYARYIYPMPTRNSNPGPSGVPFQYTYKQDYSQAGQSPDGKANYLIRNPQLITAGVNATNVVNTSTTNSILPGIGGTYFDPDYKPDMVTETNATLEQPLKWNSALRLSWVWTHGSYLDHGFNLNGHPSSFVYETQTGLDPPVGTVIGSNQYQATATGPYDQTTYGTMNFDNKTGWSNDNDLQVNYERHYHNGFAFQFFYVWSKAFRTGGNSTRDSVISPYENYVGTYANPNVTISSLHPISPAPLPPPPPAGVQPWADYHALDHWEKYMDGDITPQRIRWNYIVDLPFGRGKKFFGNANRLVNELIGGYQLSGDGSASLNTLNPVSTNWGPTAPIKIYKHSMPVTDCTTGTCFHEYMWFNGYVAPTANASTGMCTAAYGVGNASNGQPKCVYGLPKDYVPYQQPINTVPTPTGSTTGDGTYYNTNDVTVASTVPGFNAKNGGAPETGVAYSTGGQIGNRYYHTLIDGPWNWVADASLFKVFPITERFNLRFNMDVFNFLNHQGYNNPNTTSGLQTYVAGGQSGATSANAGRQMQFTLRLSF